MLFVCNYSSSWIPAAWLNEYHPISSHLHFYAVFDYFLKMQIIRKQQITGSSAQTLWEQCHVEIWEFQRKWEEQPKRQVHDFSSDVNRPVAPASRGGELLLCQHRLFHLTEPGAGACAGTLSNFFSATLHFKQDRTCLEQYSKEMCLCILCVLLFNGLESFTKILFNVRSVGGISLVDYRKANMIVVQIVTVTFCKVICAHQCLCCSPSSFFF